MSAVIKLDEAKFFLELLDALETRKRPLTNQQNAAREVSYLLSAFLNAVYSALEQAKPTIGEDAIKEYKDTHRTLLGGKGIRNMTIHEEHVDVSHSGYVPPPGNAVNFDFRQTPRLIQEEQERTSSVNLRFGPSHYIEYEGKLVHVTDLCSKQLYELLAFFITHGVLTHSE
ncbi:hypothetical protein B7R78_0009680 [Ralstonia solanacearum]|uniref:hypothetical protein n=1 Tax=Ralstonia solanacearum species complex TaxID=3116862 RepID=UPI00025016DF|nr:hypothetical protein [Ralstonia solanacearum]MBT1537395.1 hypothetical protein [Ralstonia solanacearum]CCF96930.1 hypothetical protein RSK60_1720059 [Ralstonia solanacearum K60]